MRLARTYWENRGARHSARNFDLPSKNFGRADVSRPKGYPWPLDVP